MGERKIFRARGVGDHEERNTSTVDVDTTAIFDEAMADESCALLMIPPLFLFSYCCVIWDFRDSINTSLGFL
jgi:hypothetical protein